MAALKNITEELAKITKALEKKGAGKGKPKADPETGEKQMLPISQRISRQQRNLWRQNYHKHGEEKQKYFETPERLTAEVGDSTNNSKRPQISHQKYHAFQTS